jgi:hypothetical protein
VRMRIDACMTFSSFALHQSHLKSRVESGPARTKVIRHQPALPVQLRARCIGMPPPL